MSLSTAAGLRQLMTPEEVAEYLGCTTAHLAQLRFVGKGPRYLTVTPRKIRYDLEDLAAYVESQKRMQTNESV